MDDPLDISEVVRRTGLTSRALRFYEARGLVSPLRTHTGRRLYGPGELERIAQILALKRAGLTLAQIQRLTAKRPLDLKRLIEAQLEALAAREAELAKAWRLMAANGRSSAHGSRQPCRSTRRARKPKPFMTSGRLCSRRSRRWRRRA